jgi:hypothetical protein
MVLWGWKAGVVTVPIRLADATAANRRWYEADGWTTAVYKQGTPPTGFRLVAW